MMIDINKAHKIYLGTDCRGGYQPAGPDRRLERAFPQISAVVMTLIQPYLDFATGPDWKTDDLMQIGKAFEVSIKRKFPELEEIVIRSLANRFTYSWR